MNWKNYLFSKEYGSLYYRLSYFFKYQLPFSKGWNTYHNPWYHWWKARKYFKRPKAHFLFTKNFWTFGLPCRRDYYNPILSINFDALGWKDKYNSPRHEWDPMINIVFFRTWHLIWIFNWVDKTDDHSNTRSAATWEAILDYLYYSVPNDQLSKNHIWMCEDEIITINQNMKC